MGNTEDLNFTRQVIKRHKAASPTVLVSPASKLGQVRYDTFADRQVSECWDVEWLQEVAEFCKEMGVRFSLQLHKVIWGNRQGV